MLLCVRHIGYGGDKARLRRAEELSDVRDGIYHAAALRHPQGAELITADAAWLLLRVTHDRDRLRRRLSGDEGADRRRLVDGTLAALCGSWLGGSGNMVAVQAALGVSEADMGYALVVDSIGYSIWVMFLLWLITLAARFNVWNKADTTRSSMLSAQP